MWLALAFAPRCAMLSGQKVITTRPRAPTGLGDIWSASQLLSSSFEPSRAPAAVAVSLCAPWLDAHAFCAPSISDSPLIAIVQREEGTGGAGAQVVGVAQAMLVDLRQNVGVGAGSRVAFVQNVAVSPAYRRQGIASRLVCEVEKLAVAEWGVSESWLAAAEDEEHLRQLYEGLGYERVGNELGQVLMQKSLFSTDTLEDATAPSSQSYAVDEFVDSSRSPISMDEKDHRAVPKASGGASASALVTELAVQSMYTGIGCLGIFFLVQPFGGTPLVDLLPAPGAPLATLAEATLGLSLALAELTRLSAWPWSSDAREMPPITCGQASQLAPLWRVAGQEQRLPVAVAAIATWQLSIAVAEEIYYRGLVLSGLRSGILGLVGFGISVPEPLPSLLAATVSAAIFGAVHLEFSSSAEPGDAFAGENESQDSPARWFRVTAMYGLAYGGLFLARGFICSLPCACMQALILGFALAGGSS